MKQLLDIEKSGLTINRFENQAEWDAFANQFRPRGYYYNPQPRSLYAPGKFPCTMISAPDCIIYNSNMNDEYWSMWLDDDDCIITINEGG